MSIWIDMPNGAGGKLRIENNVIEAAPRTGWTGTHQYRFTLAMLMAFAIMLGIVIATRNTLLTAWCAGMVCFNLNRLWR